MLECNLHGWIVLCGERAGKCQIESRTLYFGTAKAAITAWNTRSDIVAAKAARIAELEAENANLRDALDSAESLCRDRAGKGESDV